MTIGRYNETGGSNDTTLMGRPSEIWVDPSDNEVFVADGYGNRRIIVFDGANRQIPSPLGRLRQSSRRSRRQRCGSWRRSRGRGQCWTGRAWVAVEEQRRRIAADVEDVPVAAAAAALEDRESSARSRSRKSRCSRHDPSRSGTTAPILDSTRDHGSRDGFIYLADRANNRIQVFRQNGQFVREKILRPRCGSQESCDVDAKTPVRHRGDILTRLLARHSADVHL
jgi:hypothetical protein